MKLYVVMALTLAVFFANVVQLMKVFFRLTYYLHHHLVRYLEQLRLNSPVLFVVSLSIISPLTGPSVTSSFKATPLMPTIGQIAQPSAFLPTIQYKTVPKRSLVGTVFAYTSTVNQTDATPTITASGLNVTAGTLATNCLPFGTKVRFPSLYGNKEFTVTDRMAPRHSCSSFDIWQESLTEAKQFGRQIALVEVY